MATTKDLGDIIKITPQDALTYPGTGRVGQSGVDVDGKNIYVAEEATKFGIFPSKFGSEISDLKNFGYYKFTLNYVMGSGGTITSYKIDMGVVQLNPYSFSNGVPFIFTPVKIYNVDSTPTLFRIVLTKTTAGMAENWKVIPQSSTSISSMEDMSTLLAGYSVTVERLNLGY